MLKAIGRGRYIAMGAFLVIAVAPVALLGVMWLAPALLGNPHMLVWALPSERTLHLLGKSFLLAATVTAMSTVLGTGLAVWMVSEGWGRKLVRAAYLVPFFIPSYIHVLTWMAIAGRRQLLDQLFTFITGVERLTFSAYGFWPTALVLTSISFPIVALLVRTSLEAIESELLEAASLVKAPWSVVRHIVLPLALPSIQAGAGLAFVLTLIEYGVPSMFENNVYVMEIYASFSQDYDLQKALAISIPLIALAVVILVLSQWRLRSNPLRGKPGSSLHLATSTLPLPVRALLLLSVSVWCISSTAPVLVLLTRGGLPSVMTAALAPAGREIVLTFIVALVCAIGVAIIAIPLAAALTGSSSNWKLGWLVCALPLAIPSPVIGTALIHLWSQPWLAWGYGTNLMLMVAHVARFLPFGVYAAASRVRNVDPLLLEAASLPDVGSWRRFLWVSLPISIPALSITSLVAFTLSLGELGASLLIAPPGEATLTMRVYNLLHYGATDTVAALSLVILLMAGLAFVAVFGIQQRLWKSKV